MTDPKESSGSRLSVITVDQIISGASNVLIALIAAHALNASDFGLFGIAFLLYTILIGVSRAIVSDPLLVHPVESQARRGEVIGTSWMVAIPLAAGLLAIGAVIRIWSGALGDALLVLAACLPLLVLQDVGRYLSYAWGRPVLSIILDSAWFVAMLGGVAALAIADLHTLPAFIAAWGGSGALAGLIVLVMVPPRELRFGLAWLRHTWTIGWQFLVSYIALQGSALGMSSEVGAIDGARALGGVQGVTLLTRPFSTFAIAVMAAGIGQVARAAGDRLRVRRHALTLAAVAGGAATINLAGMMLLPDGLGHLLLGHAWRPAEPLLLPTGIGIVFIGLSRGPQAALIGCKDTRTAMAINVASVPLLLVGILCGALVDGVLGALWVAAAVQALIAIIWWVTYGARSHEPGVSGAAGVVLTPVRAAKAVASTPATASGGIVLTPVSAAPPRLQRIRVLR